MLKVLLPVSAALMLSGCIVHVKGPGQAPKYQKSEQLELSAADITKLVADTDAGSFTLKGDSNTDKITVNANISAYSPTDYTLKLTQHGQRAKLVANASNSNTFQVNSAGPKIDLTITLPAHINLDLDDGSGPIVIEGLNSDIEIEDGSGSIKLVGAKNVEIDDGSGSVHVLNSSGDVSINDGSGEIQVKQTLGTVTIDDGSGSIDVDGAGALVIESAGSGGVNINNVKGEVKVEE